MYLRAIFHRRLSNGESNSGAQRFFHHPSASDNPFEQPIRPIPTANRHKNRCEKKPAKKTGLPTSHEIHRTPRSHGSIGRQLTCQNCMIGTPLSTLPQPTHNCPVGSIRLCRTVFLLRSVEKSPLHSLSLRLGSRAKDRTDLPTEHDDSCRKADPLPLHCGPSTYDYRITTPVPRQTGPRPCFDSLPAMNQSGDVAMPPITQCLAAKSESVAAIRRDYMTAF